LFADVDVTYVGDVDDVSVVVVVDIVAAVVLDVVVDVVVGFALALVDANVEVVGALDVGTTTNNNVFA
jgi:hypothetical protein